MPLMVDLLSIYPYYYFYYYQWLTLHRVCQCAVEAVIVEFKTRGVQGDRTTDPA